MLRNITTVDVWTAGARYRHLNKCSTSSTANAGLRTQAHITHCKKRKKKAVYITLIGYLMK